MAVASSPQKQRRHVGGASFHAQPPQVGGIHAQYLPGCNMYVPPPRLNMALVMKEGLHKNLGSSLRIAAGPLKS
jgi:hypothetical protein